MKTGAKCRLESKTSKEFTRHTAKIIYGKVKKIIIFLKLSKPTKVSTKVAATENAGSFTTA